MLVMVFEPISVALATALSSLLVVFASRSRPMAWKPIAPSGTVIDGVVTVVVPVSSTREATAPSGVVGSAPLKATMRAVVWLPLSATDTSVLDSYHCQNSAHATPPAAPAVPVPIWSSLVQPVGVTMFWLADSAASINRSPVVAAAGIATERLMELPVHAPAPTYSTATGHLLSATRGRRQLR